MPCKLCKTKPVINLTNNKVQLCSRCFIRYFERKVLKTIRQYNLIEKNDNIIVAVSGGKDSLSCLYLMNKIAKKKMKDLNSKDDEGAINIIAGSARSMGIEVK